MAGTFMELGAPGAGGLTKKLGGSLLGALQKGASKLGNIAKIQKILPFKEMKIYDVGIKKATERAGLAPGSVNNAVKLKTELAFMEAGILDQMGELTKRALEGTELAMKPGNKINNPSVIRELTRDGSKIDDWVKLKTKSIKLPNGQSRQIHFYENKVTGEINYTHPDYKVKDKVNYLGNMTGDAT